MSDLQKSRSILQAAKKVMVITGAGISTESGIPTFRGEGGYWRGHRAEDLASPEGFKKNPRLVWDWYGERRTLVSKAQPNVAHLALASWSKRRGGISLLTQNVDELHERAGQTDTVLLHGSLWKNRCRKCKFEHRACELAYPTLPRCKVCNEITGPGVIWFGEALDFSSFHALNLCSIEADVILTIGTSGLVSPTADFIKRAQTKYNTTLINVNPTESNIQATIELRYKATEIIPELTAD
ncbi:NAD-dependent deacylase [Candidatus Uhrbacteria bacterium]|nr:NAD-dependent deacylase [Candidatus Uhrbacteria bacterium]